VIKQFLLELPMFALTILLLMMQFIFLLILFIWHHQHRQTEIVITLHGVLQLLVLLLDGLSEGQQEDEEDDTLEAEAWLVIIPDDLTSYQ
jgi:hypothetical protein